MLFRKAVKIENCAAMSRSKLMIMLHVNSRGTTFEYQWAPDWTTFSFCFLTVYQEKNTSRLPGRVTKNIFSVARGQMLVASGDRVPLEYSLDVWAHSMSSCVFPHEKWLEWCLNKLNGPLNLAELGDCSEYKHYPFIPAY